MITINGRTLSPLKLGESQTLHSELLDSARTLLAIQVDLGPSVLCVDVDFYGQRDEAFDTLVRTIAYSGVLLETKRHQVVLEPARTAIPPKREWRDFDGARALIFCDREGTDEELTAAHEKVIADLAAAGFKAVAGPRSFDLPYHRRSRLEEWIAVERGEDEAQMGPTHALVPRYPYSFDGAPPDATPAAPMNLIAAPPPAPLTQRDPWTPQPAHPNAIAAAEYQRRLAEIAAAPTAEERIAEIERRLAAAGA